MKRSGTEKPSLWFDFSYGLLAFPLAVLGIPFYFYMPNYWFENWQISLSAIGVALLLTRLSDMVTDPLIGILSDVWSDKIGFFWQIQLGVLLLMIGLVPLFFPFEQVLIESPFLYITFFSFFAFLGWTMISVPYQAWVSRLTPSSQMKTRLTSFREGIGILGVVSVLSLPVLFSLPVTSPQLFKIIIVMLVSFFLLAFVLQWFNIHRKPASNISYEYSMPFVQLWQKHRTNFQIMPVYFINNVANAFPATLFMFFVSYWMNLEPQSGLLLGAFFVSGTLGLPVWFWVAKRYKKYQAWYFSMLFSAISFSGLFWVESGDFYGYLLICLLTGFSLGADLALPASIQADLVQDIETESQLDVASKVFGLWGMITKLAIALSIGIALPLLDFLDLKASSAGALDALWLMYVVIPILLKFVAVLWLLRVIRSRT